MQFHHIFPNAFLRKRDPGVKGSLVDDVAKLAFTGGKTNWSIRDGAPASYLAKRAEVRS